MAAYGPRTQDSGYSDGCGDRLGHQDGVTAPFGSIKDLCQLPAAKVLDRWADFAKGQIRALFLAPVVDGDILPIAQGDAMLAGRTRNINIIAGSNSREMSAEMPPEEVLAFAHKSFETGADGSLKRFTAKADNIRYKSVADQMQADLSFGCGAIQTARSARALSDQSGSP